MQLLYALFAYITHFYGGGGELAENNSQQTRPQMQSALLLSCTP
jgi:hypothetical protein